MGRSHGRKRNRVRLEEIQTYAAWHGVSWAEARRAVDRAQSVTEVPPATGLRPVPSGNQSTESDERP